MTIFDAEITTELAAAVATFCAATAAAIGAFASRSATKNAKSAAQASIILSIDERLRQFDSINRALQGEKEWTPSAEEWLLIIGYMGLFERIYIMSKKGLLDTENVRSFYGYRVENLVNSGIARERIKADGADSWKDFTALVNNLKLKI